MYVSDKYKCANLFGKERGYVRARPSLMIVYIVVILKIVYYNENTAEY